MCLACVCVCETRTRPVTRLPIAFTQCSGRNPKYPFDPITVFTLTKKCGTSFAQASDMGGLSQGAKDCFMWNWLNCYLSGRHDYSAWCEPGAIFLRCVHCGRRSTGWDVNAKPLVRQQPAPAPAVSIAPKSRVLPFSRAAAR